jgi:UDP-2-acetamido-2-deoxy-ribo-hexuluronate aminotransferase
LEHIGCTSFFPSKNLGCFGDGGAIFTDNPELAEKMRAITHHGSKVKYYHDSIGVNSRLDTLQAAILDVKLKYLDNITRPGQMQQNTMTMHSAALKATGVAKRINGSTHIYHTYTLKVICRRRDPFREFLKGQGIPTMVYYPLYPMHLQNAYSGYGYKPGDMPVSEELCTSVVSIPMHTELTD